MKKPLRVVQSPLTGNIYVVTRYTERNGVLTAHTKHDVTADIEAIIAERLALIAPDTKETER